MTKEKLREELKKLRNSIENEKRKEESRVTCERITALKEYKESKKILSFMNFGSEIEVDILNQKILEAGKILYLPRVERDGTLSVVEYGKGFSVGSFGIREPIGEGYSGELDIIITPGLGFDRSGGRLGYGKGYYDRLFTKYSSVLKIAPIFDVQLMEKIPSEEHDMRVDMIVIKNEILEIKKY